MTFCKHIKTRSLILREENTLMMSTNSMLKKTFRTGSWRSCIMRSFVICFICQILLGVQKSWKKSWVKHVAYMEK